VPNDSSSVKVEFLEEFMNILAVSRHPKTEGWLVRVTMTSKVDCDNAISGIEECSALKRPIPAISGVAMDEDHRNTSSLVVIDETDTVRCCKG
jgi:hypothetical protein